MVYKFCIKTNTEHKISTLLNCPPPRKTSHNKVFDKLAEFLIQNFKSLKFRINCFTYINSHPKNAFTLAEVLIVLIIVGVIAVLTVPNLIKNYKWSARKAQLREAQSILAQAINKYKTENDIKNMNNFLRTGDENSKAGSTSTNGILGVSVESKGGENAILYIVLKTIVKDLEYCKSQISDTKLKELNIKKASTTICNAITSARYYDTNGNARPPSVGMGEEYDRLIISGKDISFGSEWMYQGNREIYVDVNGYRRGPNRHGHDVFGFRVKPDGTVVPCGAPSYSCGYGNNTYKALYSENYWKQNNIR